MKLKKSEIKTCKVAYLYNDGHMVLVHEKRDKDAGKVEWCTIYENIGIKCRFDKPGRLIIDPAVIPFVSHASVVCVSPGSVSRGSDNTKKRGIAVETIEFRNGISDRPWFINNFPDLISSDIYFNDNDTSPFDPELYHWSGYPVKATYKESANK